VGNQHRRLPIELPRDYDLLLVSAGQPRRELLWPLPANVIFLRQPTRIVMKSANRKKHAPDAAGCRRPQHDILDDAHRLDQHEMLMDHRDARGHGVRQAMAAEQPATAT